MAIEKFPLSKEIPWDRIKTVRVSSDQGTFSFEFDLQGKKQKMTISIKPDSTAFTLSTDKGNPIVHAAQKGREVRILDFSSKLSLKGKEKGKAKPSKLSKMKPSKTKK